MCERVKRFVAVLGTNAPDWNGTILTPEALKDMQMEETKPLLFEFRPDAQIGTVKETYYLAGHLWVDGFLESDFAEKIERLQHIKLYAAPVLQNGKLVIGLTTFPYMPGLPPIEIVEEEPDLSEIAEELERM